IVDQFTGRVLFGRRYSGGLHQAIEAKEDVNVREENRTYAQVTLQNYFRLYKKIAGMTGTAETSAEEFHKVYNLDVVAIPPNKPMIRKDMSDLVYKTKDAKYRAVAEEVKKKWEIGQPVLLGTTSITNNEIISSYLAKAGVPHEVLNAKNNEREGAIIAQAGKLKAVTVATNMAGRGVDIVLGGNPKDPEQSNKVLELGGLHVVGTERHEARRIDNQLRGRSGRQGDPGSSRFFLSLEDDLMRIFGGDRIKRLMESVNFPEDTPIESGMVSKAVNQAQSKVEGNNFDIRKHLLDFDDVLNKQRTAFYARRKKILEAGDKNEIRPILEETLNKYAEFLESQLEHIEEDRQKHEKIIEDAKKKVGSLPNEFTKEQSIVISQHLVRVLDSLWIEHLENLESLRETVNIRAYAQHEPIVEYRREAYTLYNQLQSAWGELVFNTVFQILEIDPAKLKTAMEAPPKITPPPEAKNIGRNDPCWCGAKKPDGTSIKYKHCHGK
ncbi:MAG: preprotein translocase subunit SecA, partial [Patescibacteria group bacterium]